MRRIVAVTREQAAVEDRNFIEGLMVIALLIGGYFLFTWLWEQLTHWQSLNAPYNFIAAFYYYCVVYPLSTFPHIWDWLTQLHLTSYPNINLSIEIAGIIGYSILFIGTYSLIVFGVNLVLRKVVPTTINWFVLFLLPAFLAVSWFLLSLAIAWLLTK